MKIAICDDNINDIMALCQSITAHNAQHEIHKFISPAPFLERIFAGESFDLLFLDVQMPDGDGWEIAKQLKLARCNVYIAMVTVLGEYIYDCFDRVDWFTPKPFTQEKVFKILDNAEAKLYPKVFSFEIDHVAISLTAPEIVYFEVSHNNLFINTLTARYSVRLSLKSALSMLEGCKQFVQIHCSYVLNISHYKTIEGSDIILCDGTRLRLTRTYRNSFFKALSDYIRGV